MTTNAKTDYFLYHLRDRENTGGFGSDGYIGISDNFSRRKKQHFDALSKGSHTNERLQAAYNKYPKKIEFYLVTSGAKKEVEARERLLVPKPNHHWNKQTGGGPSRGMSKDEAIDAISGSKRQAAGSQESRQRKNADSSSSNADTDPSSGTKSKSKSGTSSGHSSNANKGSAAEFAGAIGIRAVVSEIAATASMVSATFASGLGAAYAINKTVLKDDPALGKDERDIRSAGRVAAYTGGGLGATGTMVAICGAGEFGLGVAGISSGLTAIGGAVGGAGAVGFGIAIAVPALAAAATAGVVYGGYKLYKRLAK
ncbi:MAG: hypothetical protein HHJ15_17205 [Rhodoferax sp.]|uniref:hypothetical protein n=1 Tax=Rhodoferax sp. TaxID=50421 RepID=UPI00184F7CE2|nr:hypothetical protein [Rhodoferax sp.]NMM21660.1 hypothetical protein [Rhodoferax sp.]